MTKRISIDEALISDAHRLSECKTRRETVARALAEYIKRRNQLEIISMFGTVDYDFSYNYKESR